MGIMFFLSLTNLDTCKLGLSPCQQLQSVMFLSVHVCVHYMVCLYKSVLCVCYLMCIHVDLAGSMFAHVCMWMKLECNVQRIRK